MCQWATVHSLVQSLSFRIFRNEIVKSSTAVPASSNKQPLKQNYSCGANWLPDWWDAHIKFLEEHARRHRASFSSLLAWPRSSIRRWTIKVVEVCRRRRVDARVFHPDCCCRPTALRFEIYGWPKVRTTSRPRASAKQRQTCRYQGKVITESSIGNVRDLGRSG
jgi:hypothetical protein